MNEVSTELLREKGYISFVDVLLRMGKLAKEDHEAWRLGNYSVSGTSDQAQSEPAQRHASHPQGQYKEGRSPTE